MGGVVHDKKGSYYCNYFLPNTQRTSMQELLGSVLTMLFADIRKNI